MTSPREAVNDSVEALYAAFAGRKLPGYGLNLCTRCCTTQDRIDNIVQTPLRQLSSDDLWPYYLSANYGERTDQELSYFAPRLLELISFGDDPSQNHLSANFIGCSRSGLADLSESEHSALQTYAEAMARYTLCDPQSGENFVDPVEFMLMCVALGLGPHAVLDLVKSPPPDHDETSLVLLVEKLIDLLAGDSPYRFGYAAPDPLRSQVQAIILSPEILVMLEELALRDDNSWEYEFVARVASTNYDVISSMIEEDWKLTG